MVDEIDGEFPASLGRVARRELAAHGITRFDQLTEKTAEELLSLHGVGPKAVRILTDELTVRGLGFRTDAGSASAATETVDASAGLRFATTIELHGKTATGFEVPSEVVEALGPGRKPRVLVSIGPHTYRSTVAVYGGVSMLPLSAENRAAAGVSAGDTVDVVLSLDSAERTVAVPDDFAAALAGRPGARASFDALSYSRQRSSVLAVEGAKAPATRARRVQKIVAELTV